MSNDPMKLSLNAEDWDQSDLHRLSVFIKDGTHGTHARVQKGIPLLSAKNITSSGKVCWDKDDSQVSEDDYNKIHSKYELEKNDLLLTVVGTLGRRALVSGEGKYTIQRSVGVIRPAAEKVTPDFLYQYAGSNFFQQQLELRSNATAQAGIYLGELAKIPAPLPPLPEQQKIAAILSSVDDVIEKTQAQINKLKDLKNGMMQELLTRGVRDENGKRHTELKDSPVGRIPVGWDVVKFGDIFEDRNEMTGDEVKYVLSSLTIEFGLVKKPDRYVRDYLITDKNKDSYKVVHPNEFLYNPMNLRWGAIARSDHKNAVIVSKYYNVLKPKIKGDLRFYEYLFKSDLYLQRYEVIATGTLVEKKRVHWSALKDMTIPLPPEYELMEISERVGAVDTLQEGKQQKLSHYKDLKKALMQDLLTGTVRVKVD